MISHEIANSPVAKQLESMWDGATNDDLIARSFSKKLSDEDDVDCFTAIERLDRMVAVAESRRNASLRELHRHRKAVREEALDDVEEADFETINPPPGPKAAA